MSRGGPRENVLVTVLQGRSQGDRARLLRDEHRVPENSVSDPGAPINDSTAAVGPPSRLRVNAEGKPNRGAPQRGFGDAVRVAVAAVAAATEAGGGGAVTSDYG